MLITPLTKASRQRREPRADPHRRQLRRSWRVADNVHHNLGLKYFRNARAQLIEYGRSAIEQRAAIIGRLDTLGIAVERSAQTSQEPFLATTPGMPELK